MAKLLRNGVDQGASTCDRFLFCDGSDPSPAYWLEVLSSMFAMGLKLDSVDAEIGGKSILTHAVENMDAVVAMALYVQGADMTDVVELKKTHREWLSQFEFGV